MDRYELDREVSDISQLVENYGDERSCVTYNGWSRHRKPEDILEEIDTRLRALAEKVPTT